VTSNCPPHIEASSPVPQSEICLRSDTEKPHARNLSVDQSDSAATKKTALSKPTEFLMEQIVDMRNVEKARRKVKANKGAPGLDGITLDEFPQRFCAKWPTIRQQLLDGTYVPQPARRKSIPQSDGSERRLGIPNIMERLIQQCILQDLTPIFDPHFAESSFVFRPKRSAHGAVKQVQTNIRSGYRHCVDMDLSKFFDRVGHDVLLARVARKVDDKRLLRLIGTYLRAGVMVDASWEPSTEGRAHAAGGSAR
jgi:RNA-directed DNA polymerase